MAIRLFLHTMCPLFLRLEWAVARLGMVWLLGISCNVRQGSHSRYSPSTLAAQPKTHPTGPSTGSCIHAVCSGTFLGTVGSELPPEYGRWGTIMWSSAALTPPPFHAFQAQFPKEMATLSCEPLLMALRLGLYLLLGPHRSPSLPGSALHSPPQAHSVFMLRLGGSVGGSLSGSQPLSW